MKKFSIDEINTTRKQFIEEGLVMQRYKEKGLDFEYFVVPQERNVNLVDFAIRLTGNSEDGYLIGVSDSLPEEYRKYVAAHEYIEYMKIGIDKKGRCSEATRRELDLLPNNKIFRDNYSARRLSFFSKLKEYFEKNPDYYTKEDIKEIDGSVDVLIEFLK